jgi:hypothetical protein
MVDSSAIIHRKALGPIRARITLALFFVATAFFIAITLSPLHSGFADAPSRGPGDVALYRAEVDRVRQGESYYEAAAAELRERGYPTRNVFNWRTPLPVWLIGKLPNIEFVQALLCATGLVLLCLSFKLLAEQAGVKQALLGVFLLGGALLPCVLGDLVVMSELWCGELIALSAVAFALERTRLGVVAAIGALFFRELAAPYVLVCLALAGWERRYRELARWGIGLAAYAVFYAVHLSHVLPRITPADIAHADGWLRFGGAGFLISTVQMNAYLLLLPQWITAVYLGCALVGCAAWNTPAGRRISIPIVVYAIAMSLVGHDFNQYWGSVTAPLMCLAAARFPLRFAQLWRAAEGGPLMTGGFEAKTSSG